MSLGPESPGIREVRFVSRPRSVQLSAAFAGSLLTLLASAVGSALLPSTVGGFLFVFVGLPLVVYAAVRGFRISLTADRHEIAVRNYFRTHHVRWEEIEVIGVGFHSVGGIPVDAVVMERRGRRLVSAQATTSSARERQRVLDAFRGMRPDLPIRFMPLPK